MTDRLAGRVAIVTGASRGIGLAIARRLVAEGARVCVTARRPEPLEEAAASFPEGSVLSVAGRADDPAHRSEVFSRVLAAWGRLDVLVNNAGINPAYGPLADLDLAVARKTMEVNVLGALAWTQEAVVHGLGQAGGCVVNVSSVTGEVPSQGIGMYGVSKAAVSHLTRTLAAELGPRVRVNAVSPAVIRTRFSRALYEGKETETGRHYPMKRLGTPEDVAGAVAYLVSDDAAWVTGQVLTIDGGLLVAGGSA
ncbi:SDR family oxidoreductase [Nonomuraea sp. CA-218870]|uniref:SDR family oxidoreductase n=1 Tax=Nonomuraea sp. CA-218870 TaxID=3239998 RepID=UPI003D8EED8D